MLQEKPVYLLKRYGRWWPHNRKPYRQHSLSTSYMQQKIQTNTHTDTHQLHQGLSEEISGKQVAGIAMPFSHLVVLVGLAVYVQLFSPI